MHDSPSFRKKRGEKRCPGAALGTDCKFYARTALCGSVVTGIEVVSHIPLPVENAKISSLIKFLRHPVRSVSPIHCMNHAAKAFHENFSLYRQPRSPYLRGYVLTAYITAILPTTNKMPDTMSEYCEGSLRSSFSNVG